MNEDEQKQPGEGAPEQPPVDNDHVAEGAEKFPESAAEEGASEGNGEGEGSDPKPDPLPAERAGAAAETGEARMSTHQ